LPKDIRLSSALELGALSTAKAKYRNNNLEINSSSSPLGEVNSECFDKSRFRPCGSRFDLLDWLGSFVIIQSQG
jgi:hypothetical protein